MKTILATLSIIFCMFAASDAATGDATIYSVGSTACGQKFTDSDFVAAIASSYFTTPNPTNDPLCRRFARVTDSLSGKSIEVQIKDKCTSCKSGDIQLSSGAFERLRNKNVGRFAVFWKLI